MSRHVETVQRAWPAPTAHVALGADEVHVWRAPLNAPASRVRALAALLSVDERRRAEAFYFEEHQREFIVCRGLLRTLLGRYLGIAPEDVRLSYGAYGKPAVAERADAAPLQFNLAHSVGLAVFAFTRDAAIGVDVERCRPLPDAGQLVERFFSPQEADAWRRLPPDEQPLAFFNCWTRKEAFIKAVGDGLSHPLDQFAVSLTPGEPARLLQTNGDPEAASRWTLHALTPADDYVAALAIQHSSCRLTYHEFPSYPPR